MSQIARTCLRSGSVFVALGVLWFVLALASPYFLTASNISIVFLQSSTVGILAAGFTLVLLTGEIDLSIASVEALAGTVAGVVIVERGVPFVLGIAAVIGMGLCIGAISGYLTLSARIPSFIATLAMLGVAQGVAFVLTGAQTVEGFPSSYLALGQNHLWGIPVPVVIAVAVYFVLYLVLSQTRLGVHIYAVGGSRDGARLAGIRAGGVVMLTFLASGALAALAGIILSAELNAGSGNFGSTDLLNAIAAVVIGGTSLSGGEGSIVRTAGGVLIITTINNGLVLLGVNSYWVQVAVGLMIVAAVVTDRFVRGELRVRDLSLRAGLR